MGDQYCMARHLWEKVSEVLEYINTQNRGLMGYKNPELSKQYVEPFRNSLSSGFES